MAETLDQSRAIPQYPADGVEFELTFNFDAPEADPVAMALSVRRRFTGQKLSGVQTQRFKLVRIGARCRGLDGVREELAQYGEVSLGQWKAAFKDEFPEFDGQGPIGFADPSWGGDLFPCIYSDGEKNFDWSDDDILGEDWRWLVPASPAEKPASK